VSTDTKCWSCTTRRKRSHRVTFSFLVVPCHLCVTNDPCSIIVSLPPCSLLIHAFRYFHDSFFMHIGSIGALLYNSSLSIYYVSVIKFNMTEPTFKKKVEFWCHFIPNAYAWGSAIFLLATNNFNSVGESSYNLAVMMIFFVFLKKPNGTNQVFIFNYPLSS